MKPYLLFFIFLSISSFSIAQNGIIAGRIIDAETREPLPFATVAAFQGEQLINGATTGDEGRFELTLPYGTYRLLVQFLSYGNKQLDDVTLSAQQPTLQLGDVVLVSSEETLQAVEVQGEAVEMQLSLDKKVFNVQDNIATKGGTATDILDNVPSVSVDTEGNVSLRGSDNVRILIDGRPSGLTGANALRQLPADLIERVEVITNPSARYEAQGMAGIINIVLKKERRNGLNGSVDVTTGWPHNHGLGVNLNIRRKAANFFVNAGTRYRINQGGGYADMTFSSLREDELSSGYSFEYLIRNQERTHERGGLSHNLRLGSDFFLNKYNTLTASVLLRRSNSDNYSNLNYSFLRSPQEAILSSLRYQHEDEKDQDLEGSLDYHRTFDEKNKVLSANIQYRVNAEQENSMYTENYFLPGGSRVNEAPEEQISDTDETQRSFLFQADYVDPIGERGQWEAGVRSSLRRINNDYVVQDLIGGNYITLPAFSNIFDYAEDIHAAYLQLGLKNEPFSYMAGLRAEYSDITTELTSDVNDSINSRSYLNLFPSAFLTYSFSKQASVQLSYSRRVRRPGSRELNPFFSFSDARNIRSGNPNLDPQFTNSLELGYLQNWGKASLNSSVYYRHTTGVSQWINSIYESDSSITRSFPVNLGTRGDLGLEFVLSADLAKWWTLNQSINLFHSTITANSNLQDIRNQDLSVKTFGWMTRMSSRMKFKNGLNFQQTVFYMGPQQQPQGSRKSMYSINLGLSKDILNDKGTLSLSVDDLLNSRKWRSETTTPQFYSSSEFQWRKRTLTLSFNYRINQDQRERRRQNNRERQEGGNGEEMDY